MIRLTGAAKREPTTVAQSLQAPIGARSEPKASEDGVARASPGPGPLVSLVCWFRISWWLRSCALIPN